MDHYARTGYGIVSEQIVAHLTSHFGANLALHIVATNYFGEPTKMVMNDVVLVYTESGKLSQDKERTPEHLEQDDFGRMTFLERLAQMDFDGIFIMQDLGIVTPIIPVLKGLKEAKATQNRKQFKSIFYFPIDCDIDTKFFAGLEFFDLIVTYTEYGRKQILKWKPELRHKLKVIPHGTSEKDYYIESNEKVKAFRKEYFGENEKELFIITNVNRNQPRKDIPATILGFMEAKENWTMKKHPFLYLHMHPNDLNNGWDLKNLLNQTGLEEGIDYMFPKSDDPNLQVDFKTMRMIYNSSNVYISTSRGEGWGLTATEAMSCGLLTILPCHTSYMEIGKDKCIFLEELNKVCDRIDNTIRYGCYEVEIGAKIIEAYHLIQENAHIPIINKALNYMDELTWGNICKKWINYFKEVY
jgi:glycosyltransferase involved in cell wall biosynthesis